MRLYSLLVLAIVAFSVVLVVQAENSLEEKTLESKSIEESFNADLKPHRRSKRTIGHIFDMFKKMMDGLFGGKGGKGKGKGRGRGKRPRRPGANPGYGAPQQAPRPSYGAPAPRPPPPPRNPGLSGGYAGGNAPPPRRPQQAPNNYGGPVQQAPNNYGGPVQQQAPNNYGGPVQQAPNNYGGPQQPQQQNQDSYGSPQADPISNQDSYGSPQAAPIGNQDSYGSPVAAPVGPQGGGQRTPSSDFGPSSVFYEIPAPNLATEAPQGGGQRQNQDSYGSPQAAPISGGQRQNEDSYGSPQAAPIGGQRQNQDSYGSPQASPITPNSAPDSYGSPQAAPQAPANSYGSPTSNNPFVATPQVNAAPVSNNYGASNSAPSSNNPFIRQPQPTYGNSAAPLPVTNNDLSGNFVPNQNSYGSPQSAPVSNNYGAAAVAPASNNYGAPAPAPVTDLNLPDEVPAIIVQGRGQSNNLDLYGSIQNEDSYGGPESAPAPISIPDNEVIVSEKQPDANQVPEGEVTSTQLDSEGADSPLFEDLRNVDFTTADDSTEPIPVEGDVIQVDLSDGVVDLTNGLDAGPSGPVDLTSYNESPATTISPNYEYESAYEYDNAEYDDDDYFGDPDVPPEIPDLSNGVEESETDIRADSEALPDSQESYGDAQESVDYDAQESYGNNADDEYYYDDEEYYYDDYEEDQSAEEPEVTTFSPDQDGANFISVPLMIEEVTDTEGSSPVILAGTSEKAADAQATYGGQAVRSSRRAKPYSFQSIFNTNQAESPQAKRQISDWSQRLANARRNRVVWRQFNLD